MTVIKVENLGKRYLIGHDKKAKGAFRYNSMRDSIAHSMRGIYQRIRHPLSPNREKIELEEFWALKDINFEIKQGDRVGIIGHNGAGKTTLLKLLSRITHPTTGSIKIKGRTASLLEVGTGFHPELSGRENIYLNGAILGMKRVEIKKKFDEIVDFAEVEKFLDTPIKRYSSGMYVRLAFAVAAHLEPEILIVDEVLAVGDAAFQKKSLGKMEDISKEGRTVLFVSHNMSTIQNLCTSAILLDKGKLVLYGSVKDAVALYLSASSEDPKKLFEDEMSRTGISNFRFRGIEFLEKNSVKPLKMLISGQDILIKIDYECPDVSLKKVVVSIAFFSIYGCFLFACRSDAVGKSFNIRSENGYMVCEIPRFPLNKGVYSFNLIAMCQDEILDWIKDAGKINVEAGDYYGTGKLPASAYQGVFIDYNWDIEEI